MLLVYSRLGIDLINKSVSGKRILPIQHALFSPLPVCKRFIQSRYVPSIQHVLTKLILVKLDDFRLPTLMLKDLDLDIFLGNLEVGIWACDLDFTLGAVDAPYMAGGVGESGAATKMIGQRGTGGEGALE